MFDFRSNTPTPFPESGSRKRFHASGMRGIDFSHKITPSSVFFTKIFKQIFFGDPVAIVCLSLTCTYLKNYNDSKHAVKTKNAPFFMNFIRIYVCFIVFFRVD